MSGEKTEELNVQEMVRRFKGSIDNNGDGDVDIQDVKAFFAPRGGVVDKIKGLFK
jgi:hypothetical protein